MAKGASKIAGGGGGGGATATPAATQPTTTQPKFSTGSGSTYQLGRIAEDLLNNGNTSAFADELLMAHPDFCAEQGWTRSKAINNYRSYIDFNDGIFTFWGKDASGYSVKYFFDTKMKFRGSKT